VIPKKVHIFPCIYISLAEENGKENTPTDVRKCSVFPIGRLSADENMWPWPLWSLVCQVGLQVVTEAKKFLKPGAFQGCCDGDGFKMV